MSRESSLNKVTVEDVLYMQSEVIRFNEMMGNDVTDKDLIPTYKHLVHEEFFSDGEFLDSYRKEDLVGICDGIIDLIYVAVYYANLNGHFLEDGEFLREHLPKEADMQKVSSIVKDMEFAIKENLPYYTLTGLMKLIHNTFVSEVFDIKGAFNEIRESNLSKYCLASETDIEGELAHIKSVGRYSGLSVEEIESDGVIYLAFKALRDNKNDVDFSKPKLIKTRNFKEPQLEQFII